MSFRRPSIFSCLSARSILALLFITPLYGCSSPDKENALTPPPCPNLEGQSFEIGDANGHIDPFGAKAAGQARAGRIQDVSGIAQPGHGRQRIQNGDFVLINDRIAIVIEDKGLSDGYGRFGGEILSIDRVGEDGKPMGLSHYNETLFGTGVETVEPTSVSVIADGSDGGDAIVRVAGRLTTIPFMEGPIKSLFPQVFGHETAYDFVLAPKSERLSIRFSMINRTAEPLDMGVELPTTEMYGFFQYSRSSMMTAEYGFAKPKKFVQWVGFDNGSFNFALRTPGTPLEFGLRQSGFELFWGDGYAVDACSIGTQDQAEIIAGGADYDGLREAIRRTDQEAPWREIKGKLSDADQNPIENAWVHELDAQGQYLSRTKTAADGSFILHAPPGQDVTLVPQKQGFPAHSGTAVTADKSDAALAFDPNGRIHVTATDDLSGEKIPVRIQVIPKTAQPSTPEAFGVPDEADSRLYQEFAVTGETTLTVPPGEHRVIVTRGYEWELFDTNIDVAAGQTVDLSAALVHSVDTTGWMCADFHIHSYFSADSNDPAEHKVKGAIADGLDIPVSSEHEWVIDFQPIIESLGLQKWAFGVPSEELTTFTWGHFGVIPLQPKPEQLNGGAIEWIGKAPNDVFGLVDDQPEKPVLIVNHPSNGSFSAYFSASMYDRDKGEGDPALWSSNFDAIEVFNDSDFEANRNDSVSDWFSLLNHGHTFWAVGSSDSHHLRTSPVGYPRTCLFFDHDDPQKLSPDLVRNALSAGAAVISGGLFMKVIGPNGEKPGDTIKLAQAGGSLTFTVTVEGPGWLLPDSLETIVNGKTVSTEKLLPIGTGPSKKFMNQVVVPADAAVPRSWVVFHAKGESDLSPLHPGRKPFAVSNPVFLEAP